MFAHCTQLSSTAGLVTLDEGSMANWQVGQPILTPNQRSVAHAAHLSPRLRIEYHNMTPAKAVVSVVSRIT